MPTRFALFVLIAPMLLPAAAQAETRITIDKSGNTSIQRNPYATPRLPMGRIIGNENVSERLAQEERYREVEKELIDSFMPPPEKPLSRKEIEALVNKTVDEKTKKKPAPAPVATEETDPTNDPNNFGPIGGLGPVGPNTETFGGGIGAVGMTNLDGAPNTP